MDSSFSIVFGIIFSFVGLIIVLCLVFLFRYKKWLNTLVNNTKKKTWKQIGTYLILGPDQVDYNDRSQYTASYAPQPNWQQSTQMQNNMYGQQFTLQQNEMLRQQMEQQQNEMLRQQMEQQQNEMFRQQMDYSTDESRKASIPFEMGGYDMTHCNSLL